ncbi:hypothetical protein [Amycolatopsis sp. NPDC054798]
MTGLDQSSLAELDLLAALGSPSPGQTSAVRHDSLDRARLARP